LRGEKAIQEERGKKSEEREGIEADKPAAAKEFGWSNHPFFESRSEGQQEGREERTQIDGI